MDIDVCLMLDAMHSEKVFFFEAPWEAISGWELSYSIVKSYCVRVGVRTPRVMIWAACSPYLHRLSDLT